MPGAVHLPHREIDGTRIADVVPEGSLVVTYCWGPHCNAATKGALRFAEEGVPVKEMLGGIDGWRREGYPSPKARTPATSETETSSDQRVGGSMASMRCGPGSARARSELRR